MGRPAEGARSLTPLLIVRGAARAIDFYRRAFGAEELARMPAPDGSIIQAELRIGDSMVWLGDEHPGRSAPAGAPPVVLHLYVEDVDAVVARAEEAGARVVMPPADMFWGDRAAQLVDPFGLTWSVATRR
jgi:uncharacterized glyoxalase superfamily protein PhnB